MNGLDYAIIALMAISILVGLVRGAVREIMNVVGWVLAVILARTFATEFSAYFADWISEPTYRVALAWLSIFVMVTLVSSLLASLVSELMRKLGLGGLNRAFGAIVGTVRGFLVLVVLAMAAGMTKFPESALWKSAMSTPSLEVCALHARAFLPESLASRIRFHPPTQQQQQAPVLQPA